MPSRKKHFLITSSVASHILTLLSLYPGLLEAGLDEAACIVPADTPNSSPLPRPEEATEAEAREEVESVASQATSILPTSESINNISSKVKTKLSGALGYVTGSGSVGDLSEVSSSCKKT